MATAFSCVRTGLSIRRQRQALQLSVPKALRASKRNTVKHPRYSENLFKGLRARPSFLFPATATMKNQVSILFPSVGTIIFLGVFLGLVYLGNHATLLGDTDTGYHIRAGEVILVTFSVPRYDF